MSAVAAGLRRLADYAAVLGGPADLYRYAGLRMRYGRHGASDDPTELRIRALGGRAVLCRPSQDVWTLRDTFIHRYHLPPVPLPGDATIVDLGSNVGYTVAHFAVLYPAARIVGVELDAGNLELARRNTAGFGPRVELVHAAIWSEDGTVTYAGDAADAFHVVSGGGENPSGDGENPARSVPAIRIATLLDRYGLETVDYLKMDVEGAEAAILPQAREWADRVRALKVEVHPPATLEACAGALEAVGYRCAPDTRHQSCVVALRDVVATES